MMMLFSILPVVLCIAMLDGRPPSFSQMVARAPHAVLHLEVADTSVKREYGLMYRSSLLSHHGMVFVFSFDGLQAFWMKNTLIGLDMIFVGSDARVRSVQANVPRSTLRMAESSVARRSGSAKFVLELPAGEAQSDGLVPGAPIVGIRTLQAKVP